MTVNWEESELKSLFHLFEVSRTNGKSLPPSGQYIAEEGTSLLWSHCPVALGVFLSLALLSPEISPASSFYGEKKLRLRSIKTGVLTVSC